VQVLHHTQARTGPNCRQHVTRRGIDDRIVKLASVGLEWTEAGLGRDVEGGCQGWNEHVRLQPQLRQLAPELGEPVRRSQARPGTAAALDHGSDGVKAGVRVEGGREQGHARASLGAGLLREERDEPGLAYASLSDHVQCAAPVVGAFPRVPPPRAQRRQLGRAVYERRRPASPAGRL
jgi:hypothetical protein